MEGHREELQRGTWETIESIGDHGGEGRGLIGGL